MQPHEVRRTRHGRTACVPKRKQQIHSKKRTKTSWKHQSVRPGCVHTHDDSLSALVCNKGNQSSTQFWIVSFLTWDCTEENLWLAKLSVFPGVNDIAHHRKLTASAQRKPVDSRNHWFLTRRYPCPVCQEAFLRGVSKDVWEWCL